MIDPVSSSLALRSDANFRGATTVAEHGPDAAYWNQFYSRSAAPEGPSTFAQYIADAVGQPGLLIDVGCGNGRDSAFFAGLGWTVRGIDASSAAVTQCVARVSALGLSARAAFVKGAGDDPATWAGFDEWAADPLVYARFLLHAIDEPSEDGLLDRVADLLRQQGGIFAAEFRTPADAALLKEAQPHYRRYVDPDALCAKLESRGLWIASRVEGRGMAIYKNEDAHVARITARP